MKNDETLAVILLMKTRRDAFFLWLLAIFAGGARAPAVVSSMSTRPTHGVACTGRSSRKRVRSATRSSSPPATPGGVTSVDQPVTRGAAATFPNLASPPPMASSLSAAPGAAASVERPDGGDRGATGRVSADGGVITHVVRLHAARRLLVGERVVAEADVHPEFADFHSSPLSSTLVAVFLKRLADGCADVPYPFGEDPALCLEKGNPSIVPVPLSSIGFSYKIAWPIDAIGPRVKLFDRPTREHDAVLLGTGLVWRAAEPELAPPTPNNSQEKQLADLMEHIPAVEVFGVQCVEGRDAADYPFTSAFYESSAFALYRKEHFRDLILPGTMADVANGDAERGLRSLLLWDARFLAP